MDINREFTKWAVARGVRLNGIAVHTFPDRGLGIIAEKRIKAGDTILKVPTSAIRTAQSIPNSIAKITGTITVNGLLAAELSIDTSEVQAPWRSVLPTKDKLAESLPFMWHPSLQSLLPPAALLLLEIQKKKISLDWTSISTAMPTLPYDLYVHNWFVVSTRTFYFRSPETKPRKPISHDDCLALVPFADCFNHADVGCQVTSSPYEYEVSTDVDIEKGKEIYISYGNHSNDFLLTEYGFILAQNKWDEICLDEMILPLFSEAQKQTLEEAGFLGKYILDKKTICYRTQVALRLLCMPVKRWQRLVAHGLEDEDKYQMTVDGILLKALKNQLDRVDEQLLQVEELDCGLDSQKDTLSGRWKQIRLLIIASVSRIES